MSNGFVRRPEAKKRRSNYKKLRKARLPYGWCVRARDWRDTKIKRLIKIKNHILSEYVE